MIAHQLEIRYQPFLKFPSEIKDILVPLLRFYASSNFKISNENTLRERIEISFEQLNTVIVATSTNFIFRSDQDLSDLSANNSIADSLLFGIIDKMSSIESFTGFKNMFHYSLFNLGANDENYNDDFLKSKIFSPGFSDNSSDLVDFSAVVKTPYKDGSFQMSIGPFKGMSDLNERNVDLLDSNKLDLAMDPSGYLLEMKSIFPISEFNFSMYKAENNFIESKVAELWTFIKS